MFLNEVCFMDKFKEFLVAKVFKCYNKAFLSIFNKLF